MIIFLKRTDFSGVHEMFVMYIGQNTKELQNKTVLLHSMGGVRH